MARPRRASPTPEIPDEVREAMVRDSIAATVSDRQEYIPTSELRQKLYDAGLDDKTVRELLKGLGAPVPEHFEVTFTATVTSADPNRPLTEQMVNSMELKELLGWPSPDWPPLTFGTFQLTEVKPTEPFEPVKPSNLPEKLQMPDGSEISVQGGNPGETGQAVDAFMSGHPPTPEEPKPAPPAFRPPDAGPGVIRPY